MAIIPVDDDESIEAGWEFLLGGLSTESMTSADWSTQKAPEPSDTKRKQQAYRPKTVMAKQTTYVSSLCVSEARDDSGILERAFCLSPVNGQIVRPCVRILDRSCDGKGNILVASQDICKGQVIFTEKAMTGIQVPTKITGKEDNYRMLYSVRACQNCFKSLEPASCLSNEIQETIPYQELWPIPEYDADRVSLSTTFEEQKSDDASNMRLHDNSGRVSCQNCESNFCNRFCAKMYIEAVGDCCRCKRAIDRVASASSDCSGVASDELDPKNELAYPVEIDPVLILATKIFVTLFHNYNIEKATNNGASCCSIAEKIFSGLCGEANDIRSLGFGSLLVSPVTTNNGGEEPNQIGRQPLQNEYNAIADAIQLSVIERTRDDLFSLKMYHKVVAITQRNSISLTTGSPFRIYYQAMIRATGGRGSDRQQRTVAKLARLLGSEDGKLKREMDSIIEEKCVVKMGGIFNLAARMNHSCDPNAEIRGQEYVDHNIDVVAKKDILKGEEICISYINLGKNPSNSIFAKNRRQRELHSRYLFHCQCSRCQK